MCERIFGVGMDHLQKGVARTLYQYGGRKRYNVSLQIRSLFCHFCQCSMVEPFTSTAATILGRCTATPLDSVLYFVLKFSFSIFQATNVVFTNGDADPWHVLGILERGHLDKSVVPIVIKGSVEDQILFSSSPLMFIVAFSHIPRKTTFF